MRLFLRLFCGFVVPGAPEGSTGRSFFGEARDPVLSMVQQELKNPCARLILTINIDVNTRARISTDYIYFARTVLAHLSLAAHKQDEPAIALLSRNGGQFSTKPCM